MEHQCLINNTVLSLCYHGRLPILGTVVTTQYVNHLQYIIFTFSTRDNAYYNVCNINWSGLHIRDRYRRAGGKAKKSIQFHLGLSVGRPKAEDGLIISSAAAFAKGQIVRARAKGGKTSISCSPCYIRTTKYRGPHRTRHNGTWLGIFWQETKISIIPTKLANVCIGR